MGWKKFENKSQIIWNNQKNPPFVGDVYYEIEFVKPKKNEMSYFYVTKNKTNWVDGKATAGEVLENVFMSSPNSIIEGINLAKEWMKKLG